MSLKQIGLFITSKFTIKRNVNVSLRILIQLAIAIHKVLQRNVNFEVQWKLELSLQCVKFIDECAHCQQKKYEVGQYNDGSHDSRSYKTWWLAFLNTALGIYVTFCVPEAQNTVRGTGRILRVVQAGMGEAPAESIQACPSLQL